ncbi:MAG: L-seryl-tRNA(Sec) selenium transferase [Myxococcales bacterium]
MEDSEKNRLLRQLPSVDEVLSSESGRRLSAQVGPLVAARAARRAIAEARGRLLSGEQRIAAVGQAALEEALAEEARPGLRRVINATGVVLHTNLGRAPLAAAAVERLREVAEHYTNLEFDVATGERGARGAALEALLCELTGAEAAVAVNNNAAAVLLALTALAGGREAIVSRGELVEIGGGFRIPDVMRQSGVRLVEVGTTNKTRLADYEGALSDQTALLVKVHRSNFALVGFCEEAQPAELARLGATRGVPLFDDLGSGCLADTAALGLPRERTAAEAVRDGAAVVTFSGDKLLGGPQAGIAVGRREAIERMRRHPLQRALRLDKLTAAALEGTLRLYRDGRAGEIPALAMLSASQAELRRRAETLHAALAARGVQTEIAKTAGQVGGGALPLAEPASWAVALAPGDDLEALAAQLRRGAPPVVGRLAEDRLLLDVRTVREDEIPELAAAIADARDAGRVAAAGEAGHA